MLYQLATQVGADDVAATLKTRLVTALDHYGYFLFAAGILGQSDPALVTKWAPVMDLLAADLASTGSNGAFPDRRVFDAYAGHSWASGTSPFADGNNQESSSEAVTAWTGLATWAKASGNANLETEATWMVTLEAQSATTCWTNIDLSQPSYAGYEHQIASLNWGGKRGYGTWFSAEPAAILGIQLIPMSPAAVYPPGTPRGSKRTWPRRPRAASTRSSATTC